MWRLKFHSAEECKMTTTDVADTSKPVLDADKSRLLHTMIRVRDLDASLNFYSNLLGMKVLRKTRLPNGKIYTRFCWVWRRDRQYCDRADPQLGPSRALQFG